MMTKLPRSQVTFAGRRLGAALLCLLLVLLPGGSLPGGLLLAAGLIPVGSESSGDDASGPAVPAHRPMAVRMLPRPASALLEPPAHLHSTPRACSSFTDPPPPSPGGHFPLRC